jgi:hypothetical protein
MKRLPKIAKLSMLFMTLSLFVSSCKKDDATTSNNSSIPSNGWRIGTTNYTTLLAIRNVGQPNSIGAFDASPSANNLNTAVVLFNNTTGIAAGTYKVVFKANQSDLLADEITVGANVGYNQSTGQYATQYAVSPGQTVNATVTITGGKAKVVIPQINIVAYPSTPTSATTTFAGTLIEQ